MEKETIARGMLELIRSSDRIVIVRHVRPDGDAHGSAIGLREMLRASYPEKDIRYFSKDTSEYVDFIGQEDPEDPAFYQGALAIVLDTANRDRVSSSSLSSCVATLVIDHHPQIESFGTLSYVDPTAPACAAILCRFRRLFAPELKMTEAGALALYVGITTDTGRFRYRGTDESVMADAGRLITEGHLDLETVYARLCLKTPDAVRFAGYVSAHFKRTENGVAWIWISLALVERHHIVSYDESSNMVNELDGIEGSEIWIAFIETKSEIRVRLRSRYLDIRPLAEAHHGGGHKNACGASLARKSEIASFLSEADTLLASFHRDHPGSK